MIIVQDKIDVAADRLDQLRRLLADSYRDEAEQRGLGFVESLVSPPLKTAGASVTLWLRWQVADAAAWWTMRAQAASPTVAAVWQQVDSLCDSRERCYMLADGESVLPAGEALQPYEVVTTAYRETAQLSLKQGLSVDERTALEATLQRAGELPGIQLAQLSANIAPEYAAGYYTWDLLYSDATAAQAARASELWQQQIAPMLAQSCAGCHALGMETIGAGVRRRGITNSVKRTAYFRMLPEHAGRASRFEQDLLEMPAHIPQILNWRLSRAQALDWNTADCDPWTYVWEQEFESLDDLLGPYMVHPHHWAHIDRWFDPESGVQAVDTNLSHAFSASAQSMLSGESMFRS